MNVNFNPSMRIETRDHGPKFRVGQKVEGVVTQIDSEGIATINIGGRNITALAIKGQLQPGQTLQLQITDTSGSDVLAMRINVEQSRILSSLGLRQTEENINLINDFIDAGMPIDSEHINTVKQANLEVKLLLAELNSGKSINIKENMLTDLKSILVDLLMSPSASQENKLQSGEGGSLHSQSGEGTNAEGVEPQNSGSLTDSVSNKDLIEAKIPQPKIIIDAENTGVKEQIKTQELSGVIAQKGLRVVMADGDGAAVQLGEFGSSEVSSGQDMVGGNKANSSFILNDAARTAIQEAVEILIASDKKSENVLNEALKIVLENFGNRESISIFNNDRQLNIKNILISSLPKEAMASEIISIVKSLPSSASFLNDAIEVLNKDIPEHEKLIQIAELIKDADGSAEKSAVIIKEQMTFTKQEIQGFYYIPLPVKMGENERRVDLYMKKRGGGRSRDDFSVLVALNTDNFSMVRCVVTKTEGNFDLAFAFESDAAKEFFEKRVDILENGLGKKCKISFRIWGDIQTEFFEPSTAVGGFDMRV